MLRTSMPSENKAYERKWRAFDNFVTFPVVTILWLVLGESTGLEFVLHNASVGLVLNVAGGVG